MAKSRSPTTNSVPFEGATLAVAPVNRASAQAQQPAAQQDTQDHPKSSGLQPVLLRHAPQDDADEDDVVYAQHDLQDGEREQADE